MIGAVIVAAGSGRRFGGEKMFVKIAGRRVIEWTVQPFETSPLVDSIVIVLHKSKLREGMKIAKRNHWKKVIKICSGGRQRQDSVKKGLRYLTNADYIIIHDGARPCLTGDLIKRSIVYARRYGAAVPGIEPADTVKTYRADGSGLITLNRKSLVLVQTPQAFRGDLIRAAYKRLSTTVTDDAAAVEKLGHKVKVFDGFAENRKLTVKDDIEVVSRILMKRRNRNA